MAVRKLRSLVAVVFVATVAATGSFAAFVSLSRPQGQVGNSVPIASFTWYPDRARVGMVVTFNASGFSDDGTIIEYLWDFGDGQMIESTGPSVAHVYSEGGFRRVTLLVRDDGHLSSSVNATASISGDLRFETIARGWGSRSETPDLFTIRSRDRWAEVWTRMYGLSPPPPIDFTNRTVIAAFMGSRPSTWHYVTIENVSFEERGLQVRVNFTHSEGGGAAIVRPFHLVAVNGTWERAMYRVTTRRSTSSRVRSPLGT